MSNLIYNAALGKYLGANINMASDTIRAALVNIAATHYAVSAGDTFFNAIAAGDVLATSSALSGITTNTGSFEAANIAFVAVSSSTSSAGAIVIYKDTGAAATSPLIAYIDSYTGLPVTPNGQNINVSWPSYILKI